VRVVQNRPWPSRSCTDEIISGHRVENSCLVRFSSGTTEESTTAIRDACRASRWVMRSRVLPIGAVWFGWLNVMN
jgi:hypothetical protein